MVSAAVRPAQIARRRGSTRFFPSHAPLPCLGLVRRCAYRRLRCGASAAASATLRLHPPATTTPHTRPDPPTPAPSHTSPLISQRAFSRVAILRARSVVVALNAWCACGGASQSDVQKAFKLRALKVARCTCAPSLRRSWPGGLCVGGWSARGRRGSEAARTEAAPPSFGSQHAARRKEKS